MIIYRFVENFLPNKFITFVLESSLTKYQLIPVVQPRGGPRVQTSPLGISKEENSRKTRASFRLYFIIFSFVSYFIFCYLYSILIGFHKSST